MPFIPVPNVTKVAVQYTGYPKAIYNTFHVLNDGALTLSDAELIRDTFEEVYAEVWTVSALALLSVTLFEMRDLSTDESPVFNLPPLSPLSGSAAGALPEVTTSVVVSWRTGLAGRSNRGRSFMPGWNVAWNNGQNISSGAAAVVQEFADTLIAAFMAISKPLVIVSYQEDGVPRITGEIQPILLAQINPQIGTQRKRVQR